MTPNEINQALDAAIGHAGSAVNYRKHKLPPEMLIRLLIGMEGGSLARELHRAGVNVTPSAFSQARGKIPPETFREVFTQFNAQCEDSKTFYGFRLLAVDGSSINIPRNPESPSFVCNSSAPNGYNQLHLNALYDLCNFKFCDALIQPEPQKDEIGALIEMLKNNTFPPRTIIIPGGILTRKKRGAGVCASAPLDNYFLKKPDFGAENRGFRKKTQSRHLTGAKFYGESDCLPRIATYPDNVSQNCHKLRQISKPKFAWKTQQVLKKR